MWVNGRNLSGDQRHAARVADYTDEQVDGMSWYITATGELSRRHKPRIGLDDQDVHLILTGLRYLALSPHLPMVAGGATRDDVERTVERVSHELFGDGDEGGQGRTDD